MRRTRIPFGSGSNWMRTTLKCPRAFTAAAVLVTSSFEKGCPALCANTDSNSSVVRSGWPAISIAATFCPWYEASICSVAAVIRGRDRAPRSSLGCTICACRGKARASTSKAGQSRIRSESKGCKTLRCKRGTVPLSSQMPVKIGRLTRYAAHIDPGAIQEKPSTTWLERTWLHSQAIVPARVSSPQVGSPISPAPRDERVCHRGENCCAFCRRSVILCAAMRYLRLLQNVSGGFMRGKSDA